MELAVILAFCGMVVGGYVWSSNTFVQRCDLKTFNQRLDRVENKIDRIMEHFAIKGWEK